MARKCLISRKTITNQLTNQLTNQPKYLIAKSWCERQNYKVEEATYITFTSGAMVSVGGNELDVSSSNPERGKANKTL